MRWLAVVAFALVATGCVGAAPAPRPVSASALGAKAVPLHYLDFGGRGEPVVLLAGAGNSAWIYSDFGRLMARRHRTFALTRRGHGGSGRPAKGYAIDTMVEDLRLFLDQRGIVRAILIGHSLAGAELTQFAAKYPDRVSALVYLDAAFDRSVQGKMLADDPGPSVPPTAADRASADAFIAYVRRTRRDLRRYWTGAVERDLRASIAIQPDGTAVWATAAMFGEYWASASAAPPDYSRIRVPALAIYSLEDQQYWLPDTASPALRAKMRAFERGPLAAWVNRSSAQFLAGPENREVVEMNAGHHLFLHRPAQTLAIIERFLDRHPRQ